MYNVSQEYKDSMKKPIRNHSYMKVALGLINQEAQASATVEDQSAYTEYSDFESLFTKNDIGNIYATYEQDFLRLMVPNILYRENLKTIERMESQRMIYFLIIN